MDIVVTIPKKELANVQKEVWAEKNKKKAIECFWKVHAEPKKLKKFDQIYFIENGMITSYNVFKYCDCSS